MKGKMQLEAALKDSVIALLNDLLETEFEVIEELSAPVTVSACVQITGTHAAVLVISATESFARSLATRMLDMPFDELSDEDLLDVSAEFANILAGNIKGLSDGDNQLGVPTVSLSVIHVPTSCLAAKGVFANASGEGVLFEMHENIAATERLSAAE
jgi:hypothetical protein